MKMRKRKERTAMLATSAAVVAVAWHIMACVESPMSFAPNGDLAFTVMDPYDEEDIGKSGDFLYRLLILTADHELRILESSRTHLLSGPGYNADGSRIAYLRAPLVTHAAEESFESFVKSRYESYKQARNDPPEDKWIVVAPEGSDSAPPADPLKGMADLTLPANEPSTEFFGLLQLGGGVSQFELVVRDATTGAIARTVKVNLPLGEGEGQQAINYLLSRPQFAADGRSVHFWSNYFTVAVDLESGTTRMLASPTFGSLMSPDGGTLATLSADGKSFGLVRTDGSRATYVRLESKPSFSGLAWAGAGRLLILGKGPQAESASLYVYDTDGDRVAAVDLPVTGGDSNNTGELAVSPDGRHVVVSFGHAVFWLTASGELQGSWNAAAEGEVLAQPTFTPDSQQVAFKHLAKEMDDDGKTWTGADAIAFFTREGRELFRVPVPRAEPAEVPGTQPPQQ